MQPVINFALKIASTGSFVFLITFFHYVNGPCVTGILDNAAPYNGATALPLADSRGGWGGCSPPLGLKNFLTDFLFSKRLHVFGIFLCLFYESLLLSTLNQY